MNKLLIIIFLMLALIGFLVFLLIFNEGSVQDNFIVALIKQEINDESYPFIPDNVSPLTYEGLDFINELNINETNYETYRYNVTYFFTVDQMLFIDELISNETIIQEGLIKAQLDPERVLFRMPQIINDELAGSSFVKKPTDFEFINDWPLVFKSRQDNYLTGSVTFLLMTDDSSINCEPSIQQVVALNGFCVPCSDYSFSSVNNDLKPFKCDSCGNNNKVGLSVTYKLNKCESSNKIIGWFKKGDYYFIIQIKGSKYFDYFQPLMNSYAALVNEELKGSVETLR